MTVNETEKEKKTGCSERKIKANSQHFSIKGIAYIAKRLNTNGKCFWVITCFCLADEWQASLFSGYNRDSVSRQKRRS
jgi:hypothetical protein